MQINGIEDLSIRDISLLAEVPRYQSLRALSRARKMTPAHVSKIFKFLESRLGTTLLQRSTLGVELTPEGKTLSKSCLEVLKKIEALVGPVDSFGLKSFPKRLMFASRGFLNVALATDILSFSSLHASNIGLSLIDLSPQETMEAARRSSLDIVLTIDSLDLGREWHQKRVGELFWELYGRKGHPLSQGASISDLSKFHLIRANHWDGKAMLDGEDVLPINARQKVFGHGAQTVQTAVEIAASTDHLVYIPSIAAKQAVNNGRLNRVHVPGLKQIKRPVYVGVHLDSVEQSFFKGLCPVLEQALN